MLDLIEKAKQFRMHLDAARKRVDASGFEWYPYDSLSSVQHLRTLLGEAREHVLAAGREGGILDLGCGDGDLAFFWESLGYPVTGIDYSPSNQNGMQGLRALHRELGSEIDIREMDVDSEFPLDRRYGLTLCLGLLYHLKNSFFVLERLARASQYCVLSTRIARCLPGGAAIPVGHPLAYLVGEEELNGDDTNFWIFSEPGLRRLLERTKWEVLQFYSTGDTADSDPVRPDRDERAFCLLRSHYGCQHLELLEGWHHVEESGWRWTAKQFKARATDHKGGKHSTIRMRLFAPPALIVRLGTITLGARIGDAELAPLTICEPGIHYFTRSLPMPSEVTTVVFHLDKAMGPDTSCSRELGVIVASLEFT